MFSDVEPNPTVKNVEDGLAVLRDNNCDFIYIYGSCIWL